MLIYVLRWWPSWISDWHKKQKLCGGPSNDHSWVVDLKFKMAATAGLSLTLDPMGKMFQNASSLKPLGKLKTNCPGMIIGRSSTKFLFFYADRNSKMTTIAGHSSMLIYVLRWWPSWISDWHKKQKLCGGPSNDHSWVVWFQLSKWF
jgi:hypothetical protein